MDSGLAEPGEVEHHITLQLSKALALVGIRVFDHLVVGDGKKVSFAELGLI